MIDMLGFFSLRGCAGGSDDMTAKDAFTIPGEGVEIKETRLSRGWVFHAHRADEKDSFCLRDSVCLFIYGTVFSNRKYESLKGVEPKRLSPEDIYESYKEYGLGVNEYIKGNFSIIVFNNEGKGITVITSKLNTLPLFYYCKDGVFVFSSSVSAILKLPFISRRLNEKALAEQMIFYYPLGEQTHFKDIYQIPPHSFLEFDENGLRSRDYWSVASLFGKDILPEEDGLHALLELMERNMELYTSDADKFLLALTGGFDGRMNLALTKRSSREFLCYSYGMSGSRQIRIPIDISNGLSINYRPVYLDEGFKEKYEKCALEALEASDGTAPISRANFVHAFKTLCKFARVNITGLFGSEVIKPFYNANELVSRETVDLFTAPDPNTALGRIIKRIKEIGYIRPGVIDRYSAEIGRTFRSVYIDRLKEFDGVTRFYIFLLEEAVRKYFIQEIRTERRYVDTRTPYLDEDFLELIFRTPFAGIYKGALKKNPISRRKSQEFYARIIQKTKPALGEILTDRSYTPSDLLLPFIVRELKLGPIYLKERLKRHLGGNDTFDAEWPKNMVEKYVYSIGKEDDLFTGKLIDDHRGGIRAKETNRFYSIFSLRLWLHAGR